MINKIKTVLVENDNTALSTMRLMLKTHFPSISIAGIADTAKQAKDLIDRHKPELIFLNIELNGGSAFELLDSFNPIDFDIIFTSSNSNSAVSAFEYSAIHYLVKPVQAEKLMEAVNRYLKQSLHNKLEDNLLNLKESISDNPKKIMLATSDGYNVYTTLDIVICEADTSYTLIHFNNGETMLVSKQLKNFEKTLSEHGFARIHSKYLVNIRYIKKYKKTKHPEIVLIDGTELPISQTYKNTFETKLKSIVKTL